MINAIPIFCLSQNFCWPRPWLRQGNNAKTLTPTQLSSAHEEASRSWGDMMDTLLTPSHQPTQRHWRERGRVKHSELQSLRCGSLRTDFTPIVRIDRETAIWTILTANAQYEDIITKKNIVSGFCGKLCILAIYCGLCFDPSSFNNTQYIYLQTALWKFSLKIWYLTNQIKAAPKTKWPVPALQQCAWYIISSPGSIFPTPLTDWSPVDYCAFLLWSCC